MLRILADVKYEHALRLPDENSQKPLRLMRAGTLFFKYAYAESHDNADLEKAIAVYETAVRITPDGHECQAELFIRSSGEHCFTALHILGTSLTSTTQFLHFSAA